MQCRMWQQLHFLPIQWALRIFFVFCIEFAALIWWEECTDEETSSIMFFWCKPHLWLHFPASNGSHLVYLLTPSFTLNNPHNISIAGTNNSYQIKSSNSLARLYSTSTMEHHHFDQCLMLLSSHGNQLLANVSKVRNHLIWYP